MGGGSVRLYGIFMDFMVVFSSPEYQDMKSGNFGDDSNMSLRCSTRGKR
jgi:hypothetical protein